MLAYGKGPQALSEDLGISLDEAKESIYLYFSTYPRIKPFLESSASYAVRNHFSIDSTGRIRYFDFDVTSTKETASVKREAKNFPIQSINASVIKRALFYCHCEFPYGGPVRIVNCIHDEINAESPPEIAKKTMLKIKELMELAGNELVPGVPILADAVYGTDWGIKD